MRISWPWIGFEDVFFTVRWRECVDWTCGKHFDADERGQGDTNPFALRSLADGLMADSTAAGAVFVKFTAIGASVSLRECSGLKYGARWTMPGLRCGCWGCEGTVCVVSVEPGTATSGWHQLGSIGQLPFWLTVTCITASVTTLNSGGWELELSHVDDSGAAQLEGRTYTKMSEYFMFSCLCQEVTDIVTPSSSVISNFCCTVRSFVIH